MKSDAKIEKFLTSLEEQADGRHAIIVRLRGLVTNGYPDAEETFQYGGLLYKDGPFLYAGIFARKEYVTLELGGAARIEDPYGFLAGQGGAEGRKHLRLSALEEIESRHVAEYLALVWEAR
ncbi:DUF1801 domain-containing protein [Leucobacter chironomi]|uniref:DUF1801 domain-containing protein n=1 Tax=Leucobacter chironomi TaxID=491918 RepID=UPI000421D30D|nr:DUF1801 domain-containing protein [Leucobacter chironomi]